MRRNIQKKLADSLLQEEKKVRDKFDRADLYLNKEEVFPSKDHNIGELVREGISLPQLEAKLVEEIKGMMTKPGFYPTKSEIFRAGILSLSALSEDQIEELLNNLPKLKPGRKKCRTPFRKKI